MLDKAQPPIEPAVFACEFAAEAAAAAVVLVFATVSSVGVIAEPGLFKLDKPPLKLFAPLRLPIIILLTSSLAAAIVPVVIFAPSMVVTLFAIAF